MDDIKKMNKIEFRDIWKVLEYCIDEDKSTKSDRNTFFLLFVWDEHKISKGDNKEIQQKNVNNFNRICDSFSEAFVNLLIIG